MYIYFCSARFFNEIFKFKFYSLHYFEIVSNLDIQRLCSKIIRVRHCHVSRVHSLSTRTAQEVC